MADKNNLTNSEGSIRKSYLKHVVIFLLIILVISSLYYAWRYYLSPEAKSGRDLQKKIDFYNAFEANYKKALTEDNYGGKTPQETLDMFIDALKKGDVELAAKYFLIDTNESSDTYLTHKKWEEALRKKKEEGKLSAIINVVNNLKSDPEASIDKNHFVFAIRNNQGRVTDEMDLLFNEYSGVWKITSF